MTRYQLYHASVEDLPRYVAAGSIDAIITDPPYQKRFLPLYGTLAEVAAVALKPGGSLVVMCGNAYEEPVKDLMKPHLHFQARLSYRLPGGQNSAVWPIRVNAQHKPLLWLVNGHYRRRGLVSADLSSATNDNDKTWHRWGQSVSGMVSIVEAFTSPGDLICDPFCGGGTTGKAALLLGRRFIGLDIDAGEVEGTAARLLQTIRSETLQSLLPLPDVTHVFTCLYCGTAFPAQRSTAGYCTPAHRQAAYRKRHVTLTTSA